MNAQQILEQLAAHGVSVTLVGDAVRLTPGSRAPADLVDALRQAKPAVVAYLRSNRLPARPTAPEAITMTTTAVDRRPGPAPEPGPASPFARNLFLQLLGWAGDDVARWRRLHAALIGIYAPVAWDRTDDRDILVMWMAARLGAVQASRDLTRLQTLRPPLDGREAAAQAARQADVRFWERVARRYHDAIPVAFTHDEAAAKVIRQVIQRKA